MENILTNEFYEQIGYPFIQEKEDEWKNHCIEQIPKLKERYKEIMKEDLNLEDPKSLTEKIQWLKIYDSTLLKTICSDKITARTYVKQILNKDIFIPILDIKNSFDEIDFSCLPNDFVIKTNHGSHSNIIVRNKTINVAEARRKFNSWLNKDWSFFGYEMAYSRINKKIFIEQYMENSDNCLVDYKFLCFNGVPSFCQVISDRFKPTKHLNYYDMDFTPMTKFSRIDFPANYDIIDKKPTTWESMKDIATTLSKEFKFVRVDFYEINNQVFLSELTFFPAAGFIIYTDPELNNYFGSLLNL